LVRGDGHVLHKKSIPIKTTSSHIIDQILLSISLLLKEIKVGQELIGIGMGAPGNVNRLKGTIQGAYNLSGLEDQAIVEIIQKKHSYPIFIDNDATNAAKGEFLFGAGKNCQHMVALTIGTGIGGGIILNGQVFHGITDYAGEIGHMTVVPNGRLCSCGNYGCLEAYSSASAMVDQARQALRRRETSQLETLKPNEINSERICYWANEGDSLCESIVQDAGHFIGLAIANIINLLNIPLVVVGGGVSAGGKVLFQSIDESANKHVLPRLRGTFRVEKALLGNDAGVIGSASAVFMEGLEHTHTL
ncbi:MAG TPA: ROK family protein, partial [Spirochaetes bacterium]|nr:ROK family protein [Spirochaetota bacterium]